jgi:hypothetical protein
LFDQKSENHLSLKRRKKYSKLRKEERLYIKQQLEKHPRYKQLIMAEYKLSSSTVHRITEDAKDQNEFNMVGNDSSSDTNVLQSPDQLIVNNVVSPPAIPMTVRRIRDVILSTTGK